MDKITSFYLRLSQVVKRPYLNLAFTLIAVFLLIIGVGAPEDGGGGIK